MIRDFARPNGRQRLERLGKFDFEAASAGPNANHRPHGTGRHILSCIASYGNSELHEIQFTDLGGASGQRLWERGGDGHS